MLQRYSLASHFSVTATILLLFILPPAHTATADPFIGEVRMFAGALAPSGWAFCEGQLLEIAQNQALFSLLGTKFGGDGRVTFGLPDFRGRAPIGAGSGPGLSSVGIGDQVGTESVTLTAAQIPKHTHDIKHSLVTAAEAETDVSLPALSAETNVSLTNVETTATTFFQAASQCPLQASSVQDNLSVVTRVQSRTTMQLSSRAECRRANTRSECVSALPLLRVLKSDTRRTAWRGVGSASGVRAAVEAAHATCPEATVPLQAQGLTGKAEASTMVTAEGDAKAGIGGVAVEGSVTAEETGAGEPVGVRGPSLTIGFIIALQGVFPTPS